MTLEEITKKINDNTKSKEEQIRILRKGRAQLLEEIHVKQQQLDQIDYMLHKIKINRKDGF